MGFEYLPSEILIMIIQNMFDSGPEECDKSYYFAYYYSIFMRISKSLNMDFKQDKYWKHILDMDKIKIRGNNLMKRYIGVNVIPHYRDTLFNYDGKYKDAKISLKCCEMNRNKILSSKLYDIKDSPNSYILEEGSWQIETSKTTTCNMGRGEIYYDKYHYTIKKVYEWELNVNNNQKTIIEKNISEYLDLYLYYEDLYNSSINIIRA